MGGGGELWSNIKAKKFFFIQLVIINRLYLNCFHDISVNASPISVRLKSKGERINTVITVLICWHFDFNLTYL